MAEPQSGILPDGNVHAIFLTLELAPGEGSAATARQALAGFPAMTAEVALSAPEARLTSVAAVADSAWDRLYGADRPVGLAPFKSFADGGRTAPATAADLLLHIRADRLDLCFELARRARRALGEAVRVIEEVQAFRYYDSRDLTGFVDGTENPQGDEDRGAVALLPGSAGAFAGGSFVNLQRYIHDLPKWEALPVPRQEDIIARSKQDNIEYPSDKKPPTAHIKRVSIKEDGQSLEMLRHSMPYGGADQQGLYFIAYTGRPDTFARMLEAMIVADGEGHYDHLMDYSRAVTGAAFFAPPKDWLESRG